jgi:hypothetical protein
MSEIRVDHPGQHGPTEEQLQEAGVDLDQVTSYTNESGVATVYQTGGEGGDAPEILESPPAKTRKGAANVAGQAPSA